MKEVREKGKAVRDFILHHLSKGHLVKAVSEQFNISRQTVNYHLKSMMAEGLIESRGSRNQTHYVLKTLREETILIPINQDSEEERVWREEVKPKLPALKNNVLEIFHYGFTEIFNNVIEHSEAAHAHVFIKYNAVFLELCIADSGVGIFNKIQRDFNLPDKRLAILELSKGKLTSDPKNHSGEGIFFTSRVFNEFYIFSDELLFCGGSSDQEDFLFEDKKDSWKKGTGVIMRLDMASDLQLKDVFDRFTDKEDIGFTKTVIPVRLLQYEGEALISRSQAKRLIARFEKFKEVVLDFDGITLIGQGFADQVFRVFRNEHPEVNLSWINTNRDIDKMIRHVFSA